jgi:hypothetical protein
MRNRPAYREYLRERRARATVFDKAKVNVPASAEVIVVDPTPARKPGDKDFGLPTGDQLDQMIAGRELTKAEETVISAGKTELTARWMEELAKSQVLVEFKMADDGNVDDIKVYDMEEATAKDVVATEYLTPQSVGLVLETFRRMAETTPTPATRGFYTGRVEALNRFLHDPRALQEPNKTWGAIWQGYKNVSAEYPNNMMRKGFDVQVQELLDSALTPS